MAPRSDLLDHYKLDAEQIGDSVIHCSYTSDRARGLRKVKLEKRWDNVKPIGCGSFGEVWQQKQSDSNEQRAVKVLRKRQMESWGIDYEKEIEALAKFDKAQFRQEEVVVQFLGWWESGHSVHLAMEYFEMGDLSIFISEAKTSEQDAKDIAEDLLQALIMIHSQGYTHRDLKPQNIFVVQTSPKYWVKLGDFGISKRVLNQSTVLRTEVGTRAFSAPETTPDDYEETFQYTNAVDMWSLGCVIYNVLAHSLPYKNSHAKSFPFPTQPLKDRVNDQGINLLECLLRVDPSARWTAQKAVKHAWLHASGEASSAAVEDATENASPVAQPERSNENQDKRHHPDDQVDMPTFISSMEKIWPKPADRTETPINQSISQSSGHHGKNGRSNSSSNNGGRRRTTSNMLISPSKYRISDSFRDPGSETLMHRRASHSLPKDAPRGLREVDTIKKPTSSSEEQAPEKMEPVTTLRDLPQSGEQAPDKMELVTTLRDLYRQKGHPEHNTIARALKLIRKGVDLEMRSDGLTALHLAVLIYYSKKGGHVAQILHELLERGADVDAHDVLGDTALHMMVRAPHCNDYDIEIVRKLLAYKADVNAKGYDLLTPLHTAALASNADYTDILLAAGARVNERDVSGQTALHWTVGNKDQGQSIARKLILAGIDINLIGNDGMTALELARYFDKTGVIEVIEEARERLRQSHRNGKDAHSRRPKGMGKEVQPFSFH